MKKQRLIIMRKALQAYELYKMACNALSMGNKSKNKEQIKVAFSLINKYRKLFFDLALQERILSDSIKAELIQKVSI